jgi:hypothetical protein
LSSVSGNIKVCIEQAHQDRILDQAVCDQARNGSSEQTNAIETPISTEGVIGGAEVVNWDHYTSLVESTSSENNVSLRNTLQVKFIHNFVKTKMV